jgi:hypothetical protein
LSYNAQLLWFEGKPVMIARPQNTSVGHIKFSREDPVFITTLEADLYKERKGVQKGDMAMMLKRLRLFRFHQLLHAQPCPACGACFARFVLGGGVSIGTTAAAMPLAASMAGEVKRGAPGPTGSTPDAKRGASWGVDDVVKWLESLELGHLAPRFRENGVDGAFLQELSIDKMVVELGMTKLQAKKVLLRLPK